MKTKSVVISQQEFYWLYDMVRHGANSSAMHVYPSVRPEYDEDAGCYTTHGAGNPANDFARIYFTGLLSEWFLSAEFSDKSHTLVRVEVFALAIPALVQFLGLLLTSPELYQRILDSLCEEYPEAHFEALDRVVAIRTLAEKFSAALFR